VAEPIEIKLVGKDESGSQVVADTETRIKSLGDTAEAAGGKLTKTGARIDELGGRVRKAGGDTEQYASRLDRAGEAGGNAESQFLGLGAGISGVSTLMQGGSLSAEEMSMAVADIGDSVEHTVVPWLAKGRDAVAGFIDKVGGIKNVAIGAGAVAAIAALGFAIKEMDDAANTRNLDAMVEKLQSTGFAAGDVANQGIVVAAMATGKLNEQFERALALGPRQAEQFIELAAASGASSEELATMRDRLDTSTEAEERATDASEEHAKALQTEAEKIRGVNDARRAAIDPLFGMLDALEGTRDAQQGVVDAERTLQDAIKEHGRGSVEAAAAQRDLNAAQDEAARSAADYESAAFDLEAQIKEHPSSLSNAKLALQRWVDQGSISEEQARRMAIRFETAARRADDVAGTRTAELRARDNATAKVQSVGNQLDRLDGRNADVYITGHTVGASVGQMLSLLSQARVDGGPVSAAAGGGPRGGRVLVGEHGRELVDLAPGSMVHSNPDTERMLAAGGHGGPPVFVFGGNPADPVARALFDWFRDNIRDSYGGDVQRGLGW
jgi:hypothetical protein